MSTVPRCRQDQVIEIFVQNSQVVNISLLSFEIQETLKAKTTMKFFTFLTEINNVIEFLNELSVKKNRYV